MDIPSIPTDNLYKFLAIGGLVAAIGGAYLSYLSSANTVHRHGEIALEEIEANFNSEIITEDLKVIDIEMKSAKADFDGDIAQVDKLLKDQKQRGTPFTDPERKTLEDLLSQLLKDRSEGLSLGPKLLENARENAKLSTAKAKAKLDEIEWNWLNFYTQNAFLVGVIFQFLGISSCIWGFFWWYFKVQRYQDQLLIKEVAAGTPSNTNFPV